MLDWLAQIFAFLSDVFLQKKNIKVETIDNSKTLKFILLKN